jgi:hypothetical protein
MEAQYNGWFNSLMSKYRASFILENFLDKNISRFADIWAGTWDILKAIAIKNQQFITKTNKIVLIEPYKEYAEILKKDFWNIGNIETIEGEFENLDINDKFDLVTLIDVLEHVEDPNSFLKKIKNNISESWYILAIVPNAKWLHRRIWEKMGIIKDLYELQENDHKVWHKRFFDGETLEGLFNECWYKIHKRWGILLKPLNNKAMENFSLEYVDALYEIWKELPDYCWELAYIFKI